MERQQLDRVGFGDERKCVGAGGVGKLPVCRGLFTTAGGTAVTNIAKWNGSSWSALSTGMDSDVEALAVSGSNVYAGGWFTAAGGSAAKHIAEWNGSNWTALGSGMNNYVLAMVASGSDVYVG